MSLIYNATFDKNTRKLTFEDKAGNEIYSFTVPERTPAVDDITKPLTFKATQDGSKVTLTKIGSPSGSFQTSRDGGNTWTNYTRGTAITLNTGDEVSFRAKNNRTSAQSANNCFYFEMTGKIEAWHNVMSLYRTNDFATYKSVVEYAFDHLFRICTSLTKAPVLPATTLAGSCYSNMFQGCESLTKAPELPATTLASDCYGYMFSGCRSLTEAPELPATTLASDCYYYMFSGCQSLKEVRIDATTTAPNALNNWLKNVSATGDFYCDPNATIFPTDSASGIPSGWRRIPPVDDVTKPLTFRATQDGSTVKLTKYGSPVGDFQTSRDGGKTWTDYTIDDVIALNTGDEVSFRAKNNRTSAQDYTNYFQFDMTGKIEAWHNVMSLYRTNDFATYESVVPYAFGGLFKDCTSLTKAPLLPATTLADSCYWDLFHGTSLTKAPELPATALATDCYYYMFVFCSKLKEVRIAATTTAPNALKSWLSGVSATGDFYCDPNATIFPSGASGIPSGWRRIPPVDDITKPLTFKATQDNSTVALYKARSPSGSFQTSRDGGSTWEDYTIKTAITLNTGEEVSFRAKSDRTSNQGFSDYFYFMMTGKIEAWHNVMSLYRTSDFATYKTVVEYSFSHLFYDCKSLTKAPALPATTLSDSCYWLMFGGCQSLTKAPELTATTLGRDCFYQMFYNCSSLNEVHCKIPSSYSSDQISSYAGRWIEGVLSTGTFYTNADANWPSGINGIPTSWTRVNA